MKLLRLLLATLILMSTPALAQPASSDVDAVFRSWNNAPGGAVGVVRGDRLVFSKGYGWADVAKRIPNTPKTVFDLASLSKQFTAVAVLIQAGKGRLDLQSELGSYLPGLPEYAASTPLIHLLGMTSGFPDYDYDASVSRDSLISQLREGEPSFEPGEDYEYLNMNYALLTYVVQKVASQSVGQVLQNTIFKPLGMSSTTFLSKHGQVIPNRAVGYASKAGRWTRSVQDAPGVADGNIFSNVEDLALWCRDLLRGSSLVPAKMLGAAWTNRKAGGELTGYGFGFEIDEHAGQQRISHTGSWYGTSTYMALYPRAQLAVIVLSNREDEDCYGLGEQVEDLYLP